MADMGKWICPNGHINYSSDLRCPVCGASPARKEAAGRAEVRPAAAVDPQVAAVEQLLEAYRKARRESAAMRWQNEVMNDMGADLWE